MSVEINVTENPNEVPGPEPRARTLLGLAAAGGPTARTTILTTLEDRGEPSRLRRVAVVALARAGGPDARGDLERFARDDDALVAERAVRALGRLGDRQSLETIDEVRRKATGPLADQAAFAAALIAHRLGLAGHDLPGPAQARMLAAPASGLRVKAHPPSGPELAAARAGLERHAAGMSPASTALALDCGPRRLMLLLDVGAVEPWDAASYGQRKHFLGQLALRNPTTGAYSPWLTVLSTPTGAEKFEVGLYRDSGQLIYGGGGQVTGQTIRFALHAVVRPGATPVVIEGRLGSAGVELQIETGTQRAVPPREPAPAAVVPPQPTPPHPLGQ